MQYYLLGNEHKREKRYYMNIAILVLLVMLMSVAEGSEPDDNKVILDSSPIDKLLESELFDAIQKGDQLSNIIELLSIGVNPNARDDNGLTALHLAAKVGDKEVFDLLLMHGASLDVKDFENKTPLEIAQANRKFGIVFLIDDILDRPRQRRINYLYISLNLIKTTFGDAFTGKLQYISYDESIKVFIPKVRDGHGFKIGFGINRGDAGAKYGVAYEPSLLRSENTVTWNSELGESTFWLIEPLNLRFYVLPQDYFRPFIKWGILDYAILSLKSGSNISPNSSSGFSKFSGLGLHVNLGAETHVENLIYFSIEAAYSLTMWSGEYQQYRQKTHASFNESSLNYSIGVRIRIP